jgi:phospholipid/cholesterol/gamma-HCH transport system substrate-binding protein
MSRRVAINLVAFVGVFVLMLWWAVNNIITFDFIERPYEISGEFAGTAGVSENSEVAYLGVSYGAVRSIDSVDGKVLITMSIDRDKQIPAGSKAHIFRKSAIGEPYIDFEPPPDYDQGGPWIEAGDVIPLERTSVPLEFSELLRSASRVLGSVDPGNTRTLIHELAVALNGRGQTLRDLTVDSDALLATFAERSDLLDSLSSNSTRLTRTVTERRASLSSAVSDLAAVAETLRKIEPDTRVLLDRGTELLRTTADLVGDVKQDLDCVLSDLDEVIELTSTDENLAYLANTLEDGPAAFDYVWLTRDTEPGGLWVRVTLLHDAVNPADQYVPPHDLPAVPEIPPCVSPLTSTPSDGTLAVEGQSALAAVPFRSAGSGTDRSGIGVAVFLVSGAILGLLARRRARP